MTACSAAEMLQELLEISLNLMLLYQNYQKGFMGFNTAIAEFTISFITFASKINRHA